MMPAWAPGPKRILAFLLVLICLLIKPLSARIGIKAGIGLSGLLSSTGDFRHVLGYEMSGLSMGNLTGFQFGLFRTWALSKRLQIQPEMIYALRGGDASQAFVYDNIVYKIKIFYVEFPVLLKYRILTKGVFCPVLYAGPYAALKLKAQKQSRIWNTQEVAALGNVKTIDYGFLIGLGGEYDLGFGRVSIELRSSLGLKNIMSVPSDYIRLYTEKDFIRNFHVSVMMGYAF
jgi:hypothetical protein